MDNQILLSILIPVYNAEKYIGMCIDSILEQADDINNIEIVIINDGSSDKTLDIINQYTSIDKRIKVYTRNNKGIGPTRNELIDKASGSFFWFIDGDDYIEPNSLQLIINTLQEDNYDMLMMSYQIRSVENLILESFIYKGLYSNGIELTKNNIFNNSLWNRIYKTALVKKYQIKFNLFMMGEDFDFIFRLIPHLGKIKCIDTVVYNYIQIPMSACSDNSYEHRIRVSDDSFRCLMSYHNYFDNYDRVTSNILKRPFDVFLMGYIYSILFYSFPLKYKLHIFKTFKQASFIPLRNVPSHGKRRKMLVCFINNSTLLILLLLFGQIKTIIGKYLK